MTVTFENRQGVHEALAVDSHNRLVQLADGTWLSFDHVWVRDFDKLFAHPNQTEAPPWVLHEKCAECCRWH